MADVTVQTAIGAVNQLIVSRAAVLLSPSSSAWTRFLERTFDGAPAQPAPATRLLEKRRQMFEVQEALDAQKEEFARRETTFKRREEMLKSKDRELQERVVRRSTS